MFCRQNDILCNSSLWFRKHQYIPKLSSVNIYSFYSYSKLSIIDMNERKFILTRNIHTTGDQWFWKARFFCHRASIFSTRYENIYTRKENGVDPSLNPGDTLRCKGLSHCTRSAPTIDPTYLHDHYQQPLAKPGALPTERPIPSRKSQQAQATQPIT